MSKHGQNNARWVLSEESNSLKECAILLKSASIGIEVENRTTDEVVKIVDGKHLEDVKRVQRELERVQRELVKIVPCQKETE